jgi:hypothetical protein
MMPELLKELIVALGCVAYALVCATISPGLKYGGLAYAEYLFLISVGGVELGKGLAHVLHGGR